MLFTKNEQPSGRGLMPQWLILGGAWFVGTMTGAAIGIFLHFVAFIGWRETMRLLGFLFHRVGARDDV